MSGFVRRAERNVAKLKEKLAAARAELTRQMKLDVERAALKAARTEKRKIERRIARQTLHKQKPQLALSEATTLLASICHTRSNRFYAAMGEEFLAWKHHTDFAPHTNLYQKAVQFLETMGHANESEGVPIFVKTMTGDLIPLEYHAEKDSLDLIRQLAEFSPEEFPLGSTVIFRLMDCAEDEPVEKSEIFGLFYTGYNLVTYLPEYDLINEAYFDQDHAECCIQYGFQVKPEGVFCPESDIALERNAHVTIYYYPQSQKIGTTYSMERVPLNDMGAFLSIMIACNDYYDYSSILRYRLTEHAQKELLSVFETVRRDKAQW